MNRRRNIRTQIDAELAAEQEAAAAQVSQQREEVSSAPPIQTVPTTAPEIQTQQPAPSPVSIPPAPPAAQAAEQPQQVTDKPKRAKLGWPIRTDLIKQCKQIALDDGVHDYEVLEQLLEEALTQRAASHKQKQQEI
jgi:outer membrane biosynthesis protein TonB